MYSVLLFIYFNFVAAHLLLLIFYEFNADKHFHDTGNCVFEYLHKH